MSEPSTQQLERAIGLATELHSGQTDKGGAPVILHPLRVMFKCAPNHDLMMVAILHDVIEDCEIELYQLRSLRLPSMVTSGVKAITRRVIDPESGKLLCRKARDGEKKEKYIDYIRRVAKHPISIIVKLKDIEDNLSIERLNILDDNKMISLTTRYRRAQIELFSRFSELRFQNPELTNHYGWPKSITSSY